MAETATVRAAFDEAATLLRGAPEEPDLERLRQTIDGPLGVMVIACEAPLAAALRQIVASLGLPVEVRQDRGEIAIVASTPFDPLDDAIVETLESRCPIPLIPMTAIAVVTGAWEQAPGDRDPEQWRSEYVDRLARTPAVARRFGGVIAVEPSVAAAASTISEAQLRAMRALAFAPADAPHSDAHVAIAGDLGHAATRVAIRHLADRVTADRAELCDVLGHWAGRTALQGQLSRIVDTFGSALRERRALRALHELGEQVSRRDADTGAMLIEFAALAANVSVDLLVLRAIEVAHCGDVAFDDQAWDELARILWGSSPAQRLGFPDDTPTAELLARAAAAADAWKRRATGPLTSLLMAESAEHAARAYEVICSTLHFVRSDAINHRAT